MVKFKNENENIWIPGHNFLDQVQYDRRKMNKNQKQFALQPLKSEVKAYVKESKISKKKQNNDCDEEIKSKKKVRKISVAKLQMFVHKAVESFPDSKVHVIAGCDLQQKYLNDIIKGKWLSGVHIHAAGVLFKTKYPGFPLQIDIH